MIHPHPPRILVLDVEDYGNLRGIKQGSIGEGKFSWEVASSDPSRVVVRMNDVEIKTNRAEASYQELIKPNRISGEVQEDKEHDEEESAFV